MRSQTSGAKTPGKWQFIAGCITLLLFSTVHMIPMFIDMFVEPTAPAEIEAKRAMASVVVDMGPFHTHKGKLWLLLSASYSTLLYFVVAINLAALPAIIALDRLRFVAYVNAIFTMVLLAISLAYQFPPPAVFALIAAVCFIAALVKARSPSITTSG